MIFFIKIQEFLLIKFIEIIYYTSLVKPMSKANPIVYGSIERKIVSSDLIEERAKSDFKGHIRELQKGPSYDRTDEGTAFMESTPELINSHKFYDMTRAEM